MYFFIDKLIVLSNILEVVVPLVHRKGWHMGYGRGHLMGAWSRSLRAGLGRVIPLRCTEAIGRGVLLGHRFVSVLVVARARFLVVSFHNYVFSLGTHAELGSLGLSFFRRRGVSTRAGCARRVSLLRVVGD